MPLFLVKMLKKLASHAGRTSSFVVAIDTTAGLYSWKRLSFGISTAKVTAARKLTVRRTLYTPC